MVRSDLILNRQQNRVLDALCSPGGVTSGELKDQYGIMDGRKRISELIDMGVDVIKVWESGVNRFGEPTRYKRYKVVFDG